MGTRVVTNGNPREADVEWGLAVKVAAWGLATVSSIGVVILAAGILRVFEMSSKLDVVEARQLMVLEEIKTIRSAMAAEDYVTHDEMSSWLRSDARQAAINAMVGDGDIRTAIQREIDRLAQEKRQ